MAHMLRFVGKCRQRTAGKPKKTPGSFRMFEFSGRYPQLIADTNKLQCAPKRKAKVRQ